MLPGLGAAIPESVVHEQGAIEDRDAARRIPPELFQVMRVAHVVVAGPRRAVALGPKARLADALTTAALVTSTQRLFASFAEYQLSVDLT